jgi:hypothetical protein
MKINELIERFAGAKCFKPEYCENDIKSLLPLTIETLVNPTILDRAEKEIAKFDATYKDLQVDIKKFAEGIDRQTEGKKAERDELKHEKSRIVSSIAQIYGEGGDGSKLYAKLAKVDSELQNIESFLFEMETLKKYPDSEKIIEKAKSVFAAGKELIKFLVLEYKPEEEKLKHQYRNLALLLNIAESQLFYSHHAISILRHNQIDETFIRTIPEAATNHSRDELLHMCQAEIEKALS